jgi:uncharacterized membrane protein
VTTPAFARGMLFPENALTLAMLSFHGVVMRHVAKAVAALAALLALNSAARATVTVCNEDSATIHVAFANQVNGSYTATGWWTIPVDSCQDIDFTLQGDTLYFAADSDSYMKDGHRVTTHWGTSDVSLFVGTNRSKKFNYTNAEKSRAGATSVKFQPDSIENPDKLVKITVHIKTVGSSVESVTHP